MHLANAEWEGDGPERRAMNHGLAVKTAGAYARVMEACNRGATALHDRGAGPGRRVVVRQEVTVVHQHVQVGSNLTTIEREGACLRLGDEPHG
jgi:hypothetical protein